MIIENIKDIIKRGIIVGVEVEVVEVETRFINKRENTKDITKEGILVDKLVRNGEL